MAKKIALNGDAIVPHVDAIARLTEEVVSAYKNASAKISSFSESGVPDAVVESVMAKISAQQETLAQLEEPADSLLRAIKTKAQELEEAQQSGVSAIDEI